MITLTEPKGFCPKFEVVGCFVEYNGKILLLHRQDTKPQGNTWGVPAGKLERGESVTIGICRELMEELQLQATPEYIEQSNRVYVTHHGYSFIYHICRYKLTQEPSIILNEIEHKNFRWVTPDEALALNLIDDEAPCIRLTYKGETLDFS